jgi:transposase
MVGVTGFNGMDAPARHGISCATVARSVLLSLKRHGGAAEGWLARLAARRNPNTAAVALANKNARIIWALLAHGRDYQAGYGAAPVTSAA